MSSSASADPQTANSTVAPTANATNTTYSSAISRLVTSSTRLANVSSSPQPVGYRMNPSQVAGLTFGVVVVFVSTLLVLFYLRKTGRLKSCLKKKSMTKRRSSTSSSRHPLEPEDNESIDAMPRPTDADLFAITEPDDTQSAGDDGYFYDEVFGSSAFEDETTNVTNKELFSVPTEDEIPDLLLRRQ